MFPILFSKALASLIALVSSLLEGTDPVESLVGPHEEGFSKGGETSHVGRSVELVLADHLEGLGLNLWPFAFRNDPNIGGV